MGKRILVIDDEEDIREVLVYHLQREGYTVRALRDGRQALAESKRNPPDLILLDLMLPGMSGLDLCRELKRYRETSAIPIMMVTAKGEESDIVAGLELGADDYVTKPFSINVLLARVRAVLRRRQQPQPNDQTPIRVGGLEILPARHEVRVNGKPISLTPSEFRLLHFLALHPGWVRTREQIIAYIRGEDYAVTERSVDVLIAGLRRKLGKDAELIETVRGVGYRFREIT